MQGARGGGGGGWEAVVVRAPARREQESNRNLHIVVSGCPSLVSRHQSGGIRARLICDLRVVGSSEPLSIISFSPFLLSTALKGRMDCRGSRPWAMPSLKSETLNPAGGAERGRCHLDPARP